MADYAGAYNGLNEAYALTRESLITVDISALDHEGDPARWLAYVTEGGFKYVTHGINDDRERITGAVIISGGL